MGIKPPILHGIRFEIQQDGKFTLTVTENTSPDIALRMINKGFELVLNRIETLAAEAVGAKVNIEIPKGPLPDLTKGAKR